MTLVMPWTQKKHPFPCLEGCFRSGDAARLFARIYQNEQMCCLIWSSSFIRKKKNQSQPSQGTCRDLQEYPAFTRGGFFPYQQTEALSKEGSALPHTPVDLSVD